MLTTSNLFYALASWVYSRRRSTKLTTLSNSSSYSSCIRLLYLLHASSWKDVRKEPPLVPFRADCDLATYNDQITKFKCLASVENVSLSWIITETKKWLMENLAITKPKGWWHVAISHKCWWLLATNAHIILEYLFDNLNCEKN